MWKQVYKYITMAPDWRIRPLLPRVNMKVWAPPAHRPCKLPFNLALKQNLWLQEIPQVDFDFKFRVEPEAGHPAWIIERF